MTTNTYSTKGQHVIADLWGVDTDLLDNMDYMKRLGKSAIQKAGATLVDVVQKQFEPSGVTLLFLLEESHLSFHTYPTAQYTSLDFYVCGNADANVAVDYIIKHLDPLHVNRHELQRGVLNI